MLACGHWKQTGAATNHTAEIQHTTTGQSLWYQTHDGGNEWNAARNFAAEAQALCGCKFIEPRGRKRSRKAIRGTGFNLNDAVADNARWDGPVADARPRIEEIDAQVVQLDPHRDRDQALALLRERERLAAVLEAGYQPVPPLPSIGGER